VLHGCACSADTREDDPFGGEDLLGIRGHHGFATECAAGELDARQISCLIVYNCNHGSSSTGLVSSPMPSMEMVTVSPACK